MGLSDVLNGMKNGPGGGAGLPNAIAPGPALTRKWSLNRRL